MPYLKAYLHNKRFLVAKHHTKTHSTYSVRLLKRNGTIAKRQVKGLSDKLFITAGDAKHNIRVWDLTA